MTGTRQIANVPSKILSASCNGWTFLSTNQVKNGLLRSISTVNGNLRQVAKEKTSLKSVDDIPGPKAYPIIGCMPYFLSNKNYNTEDSYKIWEDLFTEFGELVKLKVPFSPLIVGTLKAEDVETYMKSTLNNPIREAFQSLKKVRDNAPNNFFNKKTGLLPENGEEWWRVRSRVQAPLLKPKNVAMYLPKVDHATLKFMDRIDELQKNHKEGRVPDNFLEELYKWSLESVALVALNRELGCLEPNLKDDSPPMLLIKYVNQIFTALNLTEMGSQNWRMYRTKAFVDLETAHNAFLEVASTSIQESRKNLEKAKKSGDASMKIGILDTFLQTEGLSESDVATIVMDMLFAGVDTTSHTVGFALYLLTKYPECQKKLQQEIDEVMGDDTELRADHIARMKYLGYVLKESLRVYPLTLGNARVLVDDTPISGHMIPKGSVIISYSLKITHNEKYFKHADEFIPERWSRDRPLGEIHPFASLPFSHGKRMCIGKRIAEQEIYTFIIRALQKYNVTFESDQEMTFKTCLVTKPAIPLSFKFHERKFKQ